MVTRVRFEGATGALDEESSSSRHRIRPHRTTMALPEAARPVTPRNSGESASASTLGTHFFSFRAVTQQSPIEVRSGRRRIALNCNRLGETGAFVNLLGQEADEGI